MTHTTKNYTREEWEAKGLELFGPKKHEWRFSCPICRSTKSPNDFKQYQEKGATPNSALVECIGRYTGGRRALAFDGNQGGAGEGCDYAAYGLFRFGDTVDETFVFPFEGTLTEELDPEPAEAKTVDDAVECVCPACGECLPLDDLGECRECETPDVCDECRTTQLCCDNATE